MKRVHFSIRRSALYVAALMLLAAGCGDSSSGPSTGTVATPTPEQSFEVIMQTFKRRIEDTPSGFYTERDGERSRLMASNKVTSQVFPPTKEGDPYRAEVKVLSESYYSLRRPVEEPEAETKNDDNNRSGSGSSDDSDDTGRGVDILDPGLVTSPGSGNTKQPGTPDVGDTVITRREDKDERIFKLEYKDGRWRLLTAPNPETERAIELAFQESLATQI